MTVTEKIDGTSACVIFLPNPQAPFGVEVGCQSRNKLITPEADNAGFAKWVWQNVDELIADLGFGYHYGEFWGSGIQRGYGLQKGEKRFSLFNAHRWSQVLEEKGPFKTPNLGIVPLLYHGAFETAQVGYLAQKLYAEGSQAAPGFPTPEGIVVHLREAGATYKITDAVAGQKHGIDLGVI